MTEDDILYMLKHGRADEIRMAVMAENKTAYPEDFTVFMDQMIKEHKISRKQIAARSGLSADYTYKLLRSDKKTSERDYILAICIAVGMNFAQTQHALRIYGMPILSESDMRSHIISLGIRNGKNIDELDEWLEKGNFELIKTNPDMPSAAIRDYGTQAFSEAENHPVSKKKETHIYTEIHRQIEAKPCGNSPMDYAYRGTLELEDETGEKYYVEAVYTPEGDSLTVLNQKQHLEMEQFIKQQAERLRKFSEKYKDEEDIFGNGEAAVELLDIESQEGVKPLEEYDSFEECGASEFFRFFLILDQETDKKVREVLDMLDDTRNYGSRVGCQFSSKGQLTYMEYFDASHPADRSYFQIVQQGNSYTFTASHESVFLRIELGDLYKIYFGKSQEPEYYMTANDTLEFCGPQIGYRFLFDQMLIYMHDYLKQVGIVPETSDHPEELNEKIRSLHEQAVSCMQAGKEEESIPFLKQALELEKERNGADDERLILTKWKLASMYDSINDEETASSYYEDILNWKEHVLKSGDAQQRSCVAAAIQNRILYTPAETENDRFVLKNYYLDTISLLKGYCENEIDWFYLFQSYVNYAYSIDSKFPEKALEYTGEAIEIARDHEFERVSKFLDSVITAYSNHAWVLWNRFSSEEASFYYGRALELLEKALSKSTLDKEHVLDRISDIGTNLYRMYLAQGRRKEAKRLKMRIHDHGAKL